MNLTRVESFQDSLMLHMMSNHFAFFLVLLRFFLEPNCLKTRLSVKPLKAEPVRYHVSLWINLSSANNSRSFAELSHLAATLYPEKYEITLFLDFHPVAAMLSQQHSGIYKYVMFSYQLAPGYRNHWCHSILVLQGLQWLITLSIPRMYAWSHFRKGYKRRCNPSKLSNECKNLYRSRKRLQIPWKSSVWHGIYIIDHVWINLYIILLKAAVQGSPLYYTYTHSSSKELANDFFYNLDRTVSRYLYRFSFLNCI